MKRTIGFGLCMLGVLLVGCSSEAEVQGTVTYQGKALEGATVQFQTDDGNPVGSGTTDASGHFKLKSTQGKDRIPAGTYKVTVLKSSTIDIPSANDPKDFTKAGEAMMKAAGVGKAKGPMANPMAAAGKGLSKSLIPEKYGTPQSTTLTVTVPSKTPIELKLE